MKRRAFADRWQWPFPPPKLPRHGGRCERISLWRFGNEVFVVGEVVSSGSQPANYTVSVDRDAGTMLVSVKD